MDFVNKVNIERRTDHFILSFSVDGGEAVARVALPLTSAIDLSLELFGAMLKSAAELQHHFSALQTRIDELNKLSAEVSGKKARQ